MISLNLHDVTKINVLGSNRIRDRSWSRDVLIHQDGSPDPVRVTLFASVASALVGLAGLEDYDWIERLDEYNGIKDLARRAAKAGLPKTSAALEQAAEHLKRNE